MARIGILACTNCVRDLDCCMSSCLNDLRRRKGFFDRYPAEQPLDLVGIVSCAGCPTTAAPGKILKKVRAMAEFRIDAIHFTYCMATLCPFRESYKKAITEAYPTIEIVEGTHTPVDSGEFKRAVRELLAPTLIRPPAMVDLVKRNLEVPGGSLKFHSP